MRWFALTAMLAACDDEGGSNPRVDATAGSDSGGSDSGLHGLLFSGTNCTGPVSYSLTGDERIEVSTDLGRIESISVLDGTRFNLSSETAWQAYAESSDTYFNLGFEDPVPFSAPQTILDVHEGNAAGRTIGVIGFADNGVNVSVQITELDPAAMTIAVSFTVPVIGGLPTYPPVFSQYASCTNAPGTVSGSFSGTYTTFP